MRPHLLFACLLLSGASRASEQSWERGPPARNLAAGETPAPPTDAQPELLPPWHVVETPLQPRLHQIRASALLPAQAWSGRALGTLADAFRQIPGAIMLESFGGFEPPRLSIRGSGLQSAPSSRGVALLLDQLPLGLADGSFNSALFDPVLGGRVDVQRGFDGWRAAPATLGGAFDLRSAHAADFTRAARFEAGSFGATRAWAANLTPGRTISSAAALSFAEQDGYRDHSSQRRTAVLVSGTTPTGLAATLYHAHARYEVPGPLTFAAAMASPGSISADVRRDLPQRVSELTRGSIAFTRATAERELELGAAVARTTDDFRQLLANGVTHSRSDDASLRAVFAQRFTTGALPHQLRVALHAAHGWRDVDRFTNTGGSAGARFARDRLEPITATLQLEDSFALTRRLVGTVGVARLVSRRDALLHDATTSSPPLRIRSDTTLAQASLRLLLARDITLFASLSRAAEPPTFDDLLFTAPLAGTLVRHARPLELQRAVTGEIGARGRMGSLQWDVAAYHAAWRDEILRLADANGAARGAVNASRTTHSGIEASARWTIVEDPLRISVATSMVWTGFVFADDPVYGSKRLAGLPPHLGHAELLCEFPRGTYFAAAADWTAGRTSVDHAGRLHYGSRTLFNLRLGWRAPSYWTFFIEARNVLDRRTIASTAGVLDLARNPAATALFLPAPGRAFVVGLEWKR